MARADRRYLCGTCGAESLRWAGQCRACGAWNSLVEAPAERAAAKGRRRARTPAPALTSLAAAGADERGRARTPTGVGEVDRVLGGGLVAGSLLLLGGEPGIGKSTLLLGMCGGVAAAFDAPVIYATAEESASQVGLRAARMGLAAGAAAERIAVLAETSVEAIVAAAEAAAPALLVVDSIQALTGADLDGPAGSVGQVRAAAALLNAYAKGAGVPVIIVGHVTKDGTLAGPKTLEHLVDAVLNLEGERMSGLRLLRAAKNRFGSTAEVGVFEMAGDGLREVADPAATFIDAASLGAPGVAVAATLEGSRPLLVEVQALVAPAGAGSPRRTGGGIDNQRLALLLAVLARRAGVNLAGHDVYANLAGGLAVEEPALDLPLALALASALRDRPLAAGTVCAGEIGLTGELRPVAGLERRLDEAARLGFTRAIVPAAHAGKRLPAPPGGLELVPVATLREALAAALTAPQAVTSPDELVAVRPR
jgi:DNA repair protein RadA/Sms